MKTKYLITIIACFVLFKVQSQSNLNQFKYVIVPKIFEFSKKTDQYQLNSLTKFLLEKENFQTFFNDESFPEDLSKDRCLALDANVINESGMLKTKLLVEFKDCKNNIVFTTIMGDSKEKEYKKAYHEALREAFRSFQSYDHTYESKVVEKEELVQAKSIETPIFEKTPEVSPVNPEKMIAVIPVSKTKPVPQTTSESNVKEEIDEPMNLESNVEKPEVKDSNLENILYAQAIINGFQLVDNTPKVVHTIFYSGKKDIYMVKGKDAVIYKLNDSWIIAEQIEDKLEVNSIKIKF